MKKFITSNWRYIMRFPFIQSEKYRDQAVMVPIDKIKANPYQPRTGFDQAEINELAESIKNYGIIQFITVRVKDEGYELITGERRLRACKELGLKEIPAIIKEFSDQEIAEIALVENLQRKDLNFLEEAEGYRQLINNFNLTQSKLADKIGKSQATIANKLRLLSLHTDVRRLLQSSRISERHARALLKLEKKSQQLKVVDRIKEKELTVKETEKLVNKIINKERKKKRIITVFKDLRVFTNTLQKTIQEMQTAGLDVEVSKKEDDQFIEYLIRLPKKK
jgi:ParB family transcriptional regulator, chromosome partitioning protein